MTLVFLFLLQYSQDSRVSFCAVGDILLDRGIRTIIKNKGVDYPFNDVRNLLKDYGLAFCNLECPITSQGVPLNKIYCFQADTTFFNGLKNSGLNIFSLANNHTIDWGRNGLMETKQIIERNNLYAVGAGENQKEARSATIVMKNDLRFAFFAYVEMALEGIVWMEDKAGPAQATIEEIVDEIKGVRDAVDFIIVSFHWGIENQRYPTINQIQWAHKVVDAGADLVIGHHPHVLQGIEIYKNRFILYSLGNFIFDQNKLYQCQSGIFSCIFKKGKIDSVSFLPVWLNRFCPNLAKGTKSRSIEREIKKFSNADNTKFTVKAGQIFLCDSMLSFEFDTPIKYVKLNDKRLIVCKRIIKIIDLCGTTIDSLLCDPNTEIKDCCFIRDSISLHLFTVVGEIGKERGDYLTQYEVANDSIIEEWRDRDRGFSPWKISTADIDGDSSQDICVGVYKKAKFHDEYANRLFIYNWDGNYMYPKWFGSRLSMPYLDFDFMDVDNDGQSELISLEVEKDRKKRVMSYKWSGFRFWGYRVLIKDLDENWLTNVRMDSLFAKTKGD